MNDIEPIIRHRWNYTCWLKKQNETPDGLNIRRFIDSQSVLLYRDHDIPSSKITLLLEFYKDNGFGDLMLGYKCLKSLMPNFPSFVKFVVVTSTPKEMNDMIGPYLRQNDIEVVKTPDLESYLNHHADTSHYLVTFALESEIDSNILERIHPKSIYVDEYNGWRSKGMHEVNLSQYSIQFPYGDFMVPGFGVNYGPTEKITGNRSLASGITVMNDDHTIRPKICKDYYFGYISEYHAETETLYKYLMYVILANRDSMKRINIILLIPNPDIEYIKNSLNNGLAIYEVSPQSDSEGDEINNSHNNGEAPILVNRTKPKDILDLDLEFTIRKNFYRTILEDEKNHIKIYIEDQMSHDDVLSYMKGSNEPILVTGDQSMSEAVSLGKLFFYELQEWKQDLYRNFRDYCRFILPHQKTFHHFMDVTSRIDTLKNGRLDHAVQSLVTRTNRSDLPHCMRVVSQNVNQNMDLTIDLVSAIKRMIVGTDILDKKYRNMVRTIIRPPVSVMDYMMAPSVSRKRKQSQDNLSNSANLKRQRSLNHLDSYSDHEPDSVNLLDMCCIC